LKLSLIRLCHSVPGLKQISKNIHPKWFFRYLFISVIVGSYVNPHSRSLLRPFREVLKNQYDRRSLRRRAHRYLFHRRLTRGLIPAWNGWSQRRHDWVFLEGESYLEAAIDDGKGLYVLSPHKFGLSTLIPPVLAEKGYIINRGGNGINPAGRVERWGGKHPLKWRYINYHGDYWHRLKVLTEIRATLKRNEIVHLSLRAAPDGPPDMEISFWYKRFFLEPVWFQVISRCSAPVLPCFAMGDVNGTVTIRIYPPLPSNITEMAKQFGRLWVEYLRAYPECARIWREIHCQLPKW
jgi:hypothetical protein